MTEDLLEVPVTDTPASPSPNDWERIRPEVGGWHPHLQRHAAGWFIANGLEPPVLEPEIEPASGPEGIRTTAQQREGAFTEVRESRYAILSDERFHDKCEARKINPYDDSDPRYWFALADFTRERAAAIEARDGDPLKSRSLALLGSTFAYVYAQHELAKGYIRDREKAEECLRRVSDFHDLLTDTAERFPDMKVSDLELGILNFVNVAVNTEGLRKFAAQSVKSEIRGVQHEMAFGDILHQTGLKYRKATRHEDVKEGFDYIVREGEPTEMKIDTKAGLKKVFQHDGSETSPVAYNYQKGVYVAYSMILDEELHDGFHITEEAAKLKAEVLMEHLGTGRNRVAYAAGAIGMVG